MPITKTLAGITCVPTSIYLSFLVSTFRIHSDHCSIKEKGCLILLSFGIYGI